MNTKDNSITVLITPPKMIFASFTIRGTMPYVQNRFPKKAQDIMHKKHLAGSTAVKNRKKEARDFDDDYQQAFHISEEGWYGIPATAFRNGMISACRLVGFKMTLAKLAIFIVQDGLDRLDGMPLIRIEGEPEYTEMPLPNATGVMDLRVRPMWRKWSAKILVRFDAEQFTIQDITNLLMRVGQQVGIGAGRPDSKNSPGVGFGLFEIEQN